MIANFDFKALVDPARLVVELVIDAVALSGQVEGVAGVNADQLVFGGVIDFVLAGEFELARPQKSNCRENLQRLGAGKKSPSAPNSRIREGSQHSSRKSLDYFMFL